MSINQSLLYLLDDGVDKKTCLVYKFCYCPQRHRNLGRNPYICNHSISQLNVQIYSQQLHVILYLNTGFIKYTNWEYVQGNRSQYENEWKQFTDLKNVQLVSNQIQTTNMWQFFIFEKIIITNTFSNQNGFIFVLFFFF